MACWAPAAPPGSDLGLRLGLGSEPGSADADEGTLEKLGEFAGGQDGLGLAELVDVAGEAGLSPAACLRLCERLLANDGCGGGGGGGGGGALDGAAWARQKAVLLKCAPSPVSGVCEL